MCVTLIVTLTYPLVAPVSLSSDLNLNMDSPICDSSVGLHVIIPVTESILHDILFVCSVYVIGSKSTSVEFRNMFVV